MARKSQTARITLTRNEPVTEYQAKTVWIGLAEVSQRPGAGVLMDRNAAAVNVLALACDRESFERAVSDAFDRMGFDVVGLEDPEPLARRLEVATVDEELLKRADDVRETGQVQFGTWHTWQSDD
jgi:hypothetical protein